MSVSGDLWSYAQSVLGRNKAIVGAPVYAPGHDSEVEAYKAAHEPVLPGSISRMYDPPVAVATGWDVPRARAAILSHANGQFREAAMLFEDVISQTAADAAVRTRTFGLLSKEIVVKPAAKVADQELAAFAAKVARDSIHRLVPISEVMRALTWGEGLGFSVHQLDWQYDHGVCWPTFDWWHPTNSYYNIATRKYWAIGTPEDTSTGYEIEPGDGHWLLHAPFGAYRGWMRAGVRADWMPYLAVMYAMRDWSRMNEVHGMPMKKLFFPANGKQTTKEAFVNAMSIMLGSETTIPCPTNNGTREYDVELMEAASADGKTFQSLIELCEKRFAIRWLGQNLTTDVEGGSLAAANVHDRVRLDYTRFDSMALAETWNQQVMIPWAIYNFGSCDYAPTISWDVEPAEDSSARAAVISQVAQACATFAQAGIQVDLQELIKSFGLPLAQPKPDKETPTAEAPIYQYHLEFGLVTKNEVRKTMGLPPVPDGDEPVARPAGAPPMEADPMAGGPPMMTMADPEAGGEPVESAPTEATPAQRKAMAKGVEAGHEYVDHLIEVSGKPVASAMSDHIERILDTIETCGTLKEIAEAVSDMEGEHDVSDVASAIAQGLRLSNLAGRAGFAEDHRK